MKRTPTVRVGAFWKASKGRYFLKWRDPKSARRRYITEQTDITTRGKRSKSKADKLAAKKEQELTAMLNLSDWTWERFVEKYREEHLRFTSRDNQYKWDAVSHFVEQAANESNRIGLVLYLSDIKPLFLSEVETTLRSELSAGSIGSYMATLRSGLSWAASMEMMPPLPRRRARGRDPVELPAMRLEPISFESLQRMRKVAAKVVGRKSAKSVQDYLTALWLSGCRMREPLGIHAFRRDCHRPLVLDGDRPRFCWVNTQKGKRDVIARITRDFASDVQSRMDADGYLYRPRCETGEITDRTALSNVVSAIGKKAEVYAEPGKTATAKHFRSSFVTRWSLRGMPITLIQEMVRHRSQATTQKYYVGDLSGQIDFDESRFGDQIGDQHSTV